MLRIHSLYNYVRIPFLHMGKSYGKEYLPGALAIKCRQAEKDLSGAIRRQPGPVVSTNMDSTAKIISTTQLL